MGEQIVAQNARFSGLSFQSGRCAPQHTVVIARALQSGDETHEEVEHSAPFPFAFLFAFSVPR
jgi:hypothetical protein